MDTFCEIVGGSFDEFRLGVKRYGCFLRIQRALIIQTRARMGMGGCTLANSHAMTYEEQATEALSPRSMRRNANLHLSRDEEQALESDRVLSALRASRAISRSSRRRLLPLEGRSPRTTATWRRWRPCFLI